MTISEQVAVDMKNSMRAGKSELTGTLRLVRAALQYEKIKLGHELDESEELKTLQREVKQRRDSIDQYTSAGRNELAKKEMLELEIIQGYLPAAMEESEVLAIVDQVISEIGATDVKQMGQVIGAVRARVGAAAEGGMISKLVRARLS